MLCFYRFTCPYYTPTTEIYAALLNSLLLFSRDFPGGSEVKASACNVGDLGLILGQEDSPGEGNGNPLQYSCLENPMDEGAWRAIVLVVTKSQTRLSDFTSLSLMVLN